MGTNPCRQVGNSLWVDAYYSAARTPNSGSREYAYFFNQTTENRFALNAVGLRFRYELPNAFVQHTPAMGTFMQQNFAHEPAGFRNMIDAYGGYAISKKLWLEAGILPSPFGYENALTAEQLTLTRSLSAEHSPYYLAARLRASLSEKWECSLSGVNGWQQIMPAQATPGVVSTLTYMTDSSFLFNWAVYAGRDTALWHTAQPLRFYNNLHVYAHFHPKWRAVLLWDVGALSTNCPGQQLSLWHTANLILAGRFGKQFGTNARVEYYIDPHLANLENIVSM